MQLSKLLLFVPLVLAVASPDAGADDVTAVAQVEARSGAAPALFAKRACNANGCRCSTKHKLKQGQYCGNCVWSNGDGYIITKKRVNNHVYECSPNGDCCDYGVAKDCGSGTARCG
ncbi:uncharacterized protein E0L32_010606 [Thyridium curvatum]|uniref:SSCRP protein n=1 Tax=Thyridium curvatum TaxID=1093900 RepID=A0A507AU33_9PEZI|nr:uncharacterized protein E0L32_010606 [Thyridium curvatum]TPX07710.1 hypothetical protein E0L32_010606 [Thyridium curvatum]